MRLTSASHCIDKIIHVKQLGYANIKNTLKRNFVRKRSVTQWNLDEAFFRYEMASIWLGELSLFIKLWLNFVLLSNKYWIHWTIGLSSFERQIMEVWQRFVSAKNWLCLGHLYASQPRFYQLYIYVQITLPYSYLIACERIQPTFTRKNLRPNWKEYFFVFSKLIHIDTYAHTAWVIRRVEQLVSPSMSTYGK